MKFKIQAGAEIDVPSRAEIRQDIDAGHTSWMAEVSRGDRFTRFSGYADIVAGAVVLGDVGSERIGPQPGFVWSVKRLAVTNYNPTTDDLALYVGDVSDSATVLPHMDDAEMFSGNELVLYPGDALVVAGTVAGPGRLWLTGQAREVPVSLAWRL